MKIFNKLATVSVASAIVMGSVLGVCSQPMPRLEDMRQKNGVSYMGNTKMQRM